MKSDKNKVKAETFEQDSYSIFSDAEIRDTVRQFILAWVRGKVTINFPTASEFGTFSYHMIGYLGQEAKGKEIDIKMKFIDLVSICLGIEEATSEQYNVAIKNMLITMLAFRVGNRINGTFAEFDIEKRFQILETQVKATNILVKEMAIAVKSLLGQKRP